MTNKEIIIDFGNILNEICENHYCDVCPLADNFGICKPKIIYPKITEEIIDIVYKYKQNK